tara:strand:+ start:10099 stop:10221 length:123 start_codon:yes stop_codon:yes gene_type:complete
MTTHNPFKYFKMSLEIIHLAMMSPIMTAPSSSVKLLPEPE